jgi:hypothetical protein
MNHLAQINLEFVKLATVKTKKPKAIQKKKWFRMPIYRQQKYLDEHPGSKKKLTGKPNPKLKHKDIMRPKRKPRVRRFKNLTSQRHMLNQKQHFTQG